tara:strand:- start:736 stop:1902 length:1167 start_codon:yes stop_codon:yes gene_type:complete
METEKPRLLISTTVPITLTAILKKQPAYLNRYFDVSLVTSPGHGMADVIRNEGLPTFSVSMCRGISPLRDLMSIALMVLLIKRLKPLVVHSYTPKAGLVLMLSAWLCRVPVRIHTFTGLIFPSRSGFTQEMLIWVDRLICACATKVVPEGLGVKNDLLRYGVTRKPLEVIGNGNIAGVDTAYFSKNAKEASWHFPELSGTESSGNIERFTFCFVGRLNKDKGILELAEAFRKLPERACLWFVGDIDAAAPVDPDVLRWLENHPRIRFFGFLDDIRPPLNESDVLVLPSYREGFPNVLLQAGSMELPVIATDISGCNEVIEHGSNGWLVQPQNVASLREAMEAAMDLDASKLAMMGRMARSKITRDFEQSDHWTRMVEFYQNEINEVAR